MCLCLPTCCLFECMCACMAASLLACMTTCMFTCIYICMYVCLPASVYVCLHTYLSDHLPLSLLSCPSVRLSVCHPAPTLSIVLSRMTDSKYMEGLRVHKCHLVLSPTAAWIYKGVDDVTWASEQLGCVGADRWHLCQGGWAQRTQTTRHRLHSSHYSCFLIVCPTVPVCCGTYIRIYIYIYMYIYKYIYIYIYIYRIVIRILPGYR